MNVSYTPSLRFRTNEELKKPIFIPSVSGKRYINYNPSNFDLIPGFKRLRVSLSGKQADDRIPVVFRIFPSDDGLNHTCIAIG